MADFLIRNADPRVDVDLFIDVYKLGSHGLAPYMWQTDCPADLTLEAYVRQRLRNRLEKENSGDAMVAEYDGRPVGGIMTYAIKSEPEDIPKDTDPNIVPLIELENEAPNTRYINVVAVLLEFQGRGIGRALIEAAHPLSGGNGMSLIVEDANPAAQRSI